MNTEITIVVNSSKNKNDAFKNLAVGDYFLYEKQLYQKTNGTGEINAVQISNGYHACFKTFHHPIELVQEVNIQYVI